MRPLWRRKEGKEEAETALATAKSDLRDIQSRSAEVTKLSDALRDFHQRNHLGEALEAMILQRKGPLNDS